MENQPFINLVKHRTSCRSYEPKPVPREHLELMLEAARLAPSACNKQPWRFAVVQAEELGLGSCWIGWINQNAVRRIVGWPHGIEPVGLITVGWPTSREQKTRPRLECEKIIKWL